MKRSGFAKDKRQDSEAYENTAQHILINLVGITETMPKYGVGTWGGNMPPNGIMHRKP
jgi:hypothetical protein